MFNYITVFSNNIAVNRTERFTHSFENRGDKIPRSISATTTEERRRINIDGKTFNNRL